MMSWATDRAVLAASCGHGGVHSGSVRGRKFIDQIWGYQLLKNASNSWPCFHIIIASLFYNFISKNAHLIAIIVVTFVPE
jgi:hypothetical protein